MPGKELFFSKGVCRQLAASMKNFVDVFERSWPTVEVITVPNKQWNQARKQCITFTNYFLKKLLFWALKILEKCLERNKWIVAGS